MLEYLHNISRYNQLQDVDAGDKELEVFHHYDGQPK